MQLGLVALVVFLATAALGQAVFLLVRDLVWSRPGVMPRSRFRRAVTIFDLPEAPGFLGRLDQSLERLAVESGTGYNGMSAFLAMVVCGLVAGGGMLLWVNDPVVAIGFALLGMAAFLVYLLTQRQKRWRQIRQQFPELLDLLSRAVRSGQSVDQGIQLAGEELSGDLGQECHRCNQELQFGRSLASVLKRLSQRVRISEMRLFTTTLIVQRQSGGNLGETLDRMAAVMRDRVAAMRQMRAATGAGRAAALVISLTGPIAYVILVAINPKHMEILYTDPLGRTLLLSAFLLELVGILWVALLLRREA